MEIMRILEILTDWKSYVIGVLSGIIFVLSVFIYFEGTDYRQIKNRPALSVKEMVGTLPNGKVLERYIVPYRGRFHYVYVTDDAATINKTSVNGRTTNEEPTAIINLKKRVDK
jgi:hypothetical protein